MAGHLAEEPREVRGGAKPAGLADLNGGEVGRQQHLLGLFEAVVAQVFAGRHVGLLPEQGEETGARIADVLDETVHVDARGVVALEPADGFREGSAGRRVLGVRAVRRRVAEGQTAEKPRLQAVEIGKRQRTLVDDLAERDDCGLERGRGRDAFQRAARELLAELRVFRADEGALVARTVCRLAQVDVQANARRVDRLVEPVEGAPGDDDEAFAVHEDGMPFPELVAVVSAKGKDELGLVVGVPVEVSGRDVVVRRHGLEPPQLELVAGNVARAIGKFDFLRHEANYSILTFCFQDGKSISHVI